MVRFVFSPEWFYGIDSIFEVFSIIVTLLIAFYAYKMYKFSKNNNYKFFSIAFLLFALAFVFKILTNIIAYSEVFEQTRAGTVSIAFSTIHEWELFYIIGYLGFRLLMLLGLIGIYMVSYKNTSINDMILYGWLFFGICILSHYNFMFFHLTAFLLLAFIVAFYFKNFTKNKNGTSMFILLAFFFILLSQVFFMLFSISSLYYVVAEVLQLIGFLVLMFVYIWVIKK